ncbi:unnamed protein product, partial [Protopolystoma xenopodis]
VVSIASAPVQPTPHTGPPPPINTVIPVAQVIPINSLGSDRLTFTSPDLPWLPESVVKAIEVNCGPPIRTSMLPVMPTGEDLASIPHGMALCDFDSGIQGDLVLKTGDIIYLLDHVNQDWLFGRNRRTWREGIFPATFVAIQVDLDPKTFIGSQFKLSRPSPLSGSLSQLQIVPSTDQESSAGVPVSLGFESKVQQITKGVSVAQHHAPSPPNLQVLTADAAQPGRLETDGASFFHHFSSWSVFDAGILQFACIPFCVNFLVEAKPNWSPI